MSQAAVHCTGANCKRLIIWDDLNGRPHPFDRIVHRKCGGKGHVPQLQADLFSGTAPGTVPCKRCHGTGMVLRSHYESCKNAADFRRRRLNAT